MLPVIRIRNILPEASPSVPLTKINPQRRNCVRVYTGDVATGSGPVILEALLGSCVAVCMYDPCLSAGGMNHILLPGSCLDRSTRFGVNAMELLINDLMKRGADRRRLVAKAFGGANVLSGLVTATIGGDNAKFVRDFLATERIPLIAQRLGGDLAVHVYFRTDTGKATVHTVDGSRLPKIIHAEDSYWRSHSGDKYLNGETTLF
jgi:chemotaxis protein CheD